MRDLEVMRVPSALLSAVGMRLPVDVDGIPGPMRIMARKPLCFSSLAGTGIVEWM